MYPEYSSVKNQIMRSINRKFPPDIKTFDEIPNESEFYKTKRNENFMIYKDSSLIIFQSPFQAKLISIMKTYLPMEHFLLLQKLVNKFL